MWARNIVKIQIPQSLGLTRFFSYRASGILPAPCGPAGFPPGGVPSAQGLLVPPALAAHSPFAAGPCVRIPHLYQKQNAQHRFNRY